MHNLEHLYMTELKDIYDAESQIIEALPKLAKCASTPELQQAFQKHLLQTKEQKKRLEQVFKQLGEKPEREHCEGMEGLLKEGEELMEQKDQADPAVLDAALIAAAQKVEHYEIASYGTLCTFAKLLDKSDNLELLKQNLDEEETTDKDLTKLAKRIVNPQALEV